MAEALSYCADLVRRADHDRYLTALFAPAEARERLFALYAFNYEIAKVRETVSEPMLGQIRLQWWREAIAGIYDGTPRKHAVVEALATAAARAPRAGFEAMIDAREIDLAGRAPANLAELETYCEGSSAQLLWLAAAMLGDADASVRGALGHLGIAWALTGLIRAVPFQARARRRFVPDDVAAEAGLHEEALFALKPSAELRVAMRRIASAAERHLSAATGAPVRGAARPLMLFAPLTRAYLRRLARQGYEVMAQPVRLGTVRKIALLWWAARDRG